MIKEVNSIISNSYFSQKASKLEENQGTDNKKSFEATVLGIAQEKNNKLVDDAKASFEQSSSNSAQIRAFIQQQEAELRERIKNGQDAPTFQIGAASMTEKQWDKLMEKVDDALEAIKKSQEKEKEEKQEAEKRAKEIAKEQLEEKIQAQQDEE